MTLPTERIQAIKNTREFLRKLLDPKQTTRIPKAIRMQAYYCLKHYPWDIYLNEVLIDEPSLSRPKSKSKKPRL